MHTTGDSVWFCGNCGDGPWNASVVVMCTTCGVGQYYSQANTHSLVLSPPTDQSSSHQYTHPHQHPTGKTEYYWVCCNCGYDVNSYELNAGCTNNCGHWRDSCCRLYPNTLPKGRRHVHE